MLTVADGGEARGSSELVSLVTCRPAVPFACKAQELPADREDERGNVQVRPSG